MGMASGIWMVRSQITYLSLFDGPDTGFGNHADDRARRTAAIEGTIFIRDGSSESLLKYCRFKNTTS